MENHANHPSGIGHGLELLIIDVAPMGIHSAYAGMGQNERLVCTVNVHHIPEGLGMDMGQIDEDVQFIQLRDELTASVGESMFSAKRIVWE